MVSRSDVWEFPHNFDKTDFSIIQKDAQYSNYIPENITAIFSADSELENRWRTS